MLQKTNTSASTSSGTATSSSSSSTAAASTNTAVPTGTTIGISGGMESSALEAEIGRGAIRLADQLKSFVPQNALPEVCFGGESSSASLITQQQQQQQQQGSSSSSSIPDLQLAICRKLRELLPSNKELLHTAQSQHWIPILLSWLNLHDRPAVQVEALLALTNVAELCLAVSGSTSASALLTSSSASSHPYHQHSLTHLHHHHSQHSAAAASNSLTAAAEKYTAAAAAAGFDSSTAAAVAAAASAVANKGSSALAPWNNEAAAGALSSSSASSSKYNPYLGAAAAVAAAAGALPSGVSIGTITAPPGSVPFPPLSFSQTLSPEAVAAFDASLTQTILACSSGSSDKSAGSSSASWTLPKAALAATPNTTGAATTGGINFTSLAPPPGGAHTSVPSNAYFLPPPTPVTAPNFPQQLSASSQHMLLRHADAIPTLISLLSSPRKEIHEQAAWILGSIAAGDSPSSSSSSGSSSSSNNNNTSTSAAAAAVAAAAAAAAGDYRDGGSSAAGVGGSSSSTTAAGSGGSSSSSSSNTNNTSGGNNNNSGGKSVSARDVILAAGVMNQLIRCLELYPNNLSLQRIGSWTLSNLVDGIFQNSSSISSSSNNNNQNNSSSLSGSSSLLQTGSGGGTGPSSSQQQGTSSNLRSNSSSASNKSSSGGGGGDHGHHISSHHHAYSSADEIDMNMLLPLLQRLLRINDAEVLGYTCWALSHLCDGPSSPIAAVVTSPSPTATTTNTTTTTSTSTTPPEGDQPETATTSNQENCGLVPRLVELLTHPSWRVTKPALRTIGNIVCAECGDEDQTDYTEVILECQAVPRLKQLVEHTNREIQKEACWTLSNIAAGTVDQIQAVIDSGAIPPLVKLVKDKKTDQEVRSEACWVVLNATSCGSDSQIEVLVDEGCVSVLGVLLSEASMVMMALEGLERVLQVEETRGMRPAPLVTADLIEKARESHNSSAVIKRADRIWKTHFVQCALCKLSFSKHRGEASFCEECKCHVCGNCNCKIYHLDYQEELWAATEEKVEAKKIAKKSKNKKKKAKKKAAKLHQGEVGADDTTGTEDPPVLQESTHMQQQPQAASSEDDDNPAARNDDDNNNKPPSPSFDDDEDDNNVVDFVLYLQQTGSIIALAKLMDALEYGDEEELNDYERRMIREQKQMMMRGGGGADHPHATIPSSAH